MTLLLFTMVYMFKSGFQCISTVLSAVVARHPQLVVGFSFLLRSTPAPYLLESYLLLLLVEVPEVVLTSPRLRGWFRYRLHVETIAEQT